MLDQEPCQPAETLTASARNDASRPTPEQAERAVRTLIRFAGDDPEREGLVGTPQRVVRAYREWFAGYAADPSDILGTTFDRAAYDDLVVLRDIPFQSVCEHHLAAIRGVAHVAYLPRDRVVGISKIARVVDAFARRLQIQERLTAQIADALFHALDPQGVAVSLRATHDCMASRGVAKHGVSLVTRTTRGLLADSRWQSRIQKERED